MSKQFAVIRGGVIENVVVWDGGDGWSPPDGAEARLLPAGAGVGWRRVGKVWTAPEPVVARPGADV